MPSAAAKTVLIAGDDAGTLARFTAALEAAGHCARAASSAGDLLADLRGAAARPDLLLLDLHVASPTGPDLVQAVRAAAPRLPIVVFSGTVSGAAEVRALAGFGINGYINEHASAQQILPALAPHLFPDSFNRRGSPRVAFGAPVACHAGDTIVAAVAFDLSRGGLGVRTTVPLDTGTAIRLRFRLPGSPADLDAEARVAWSDHRTGMGLQFTTLDAAARRAIDDFVDAHADTARG